MAHQGPRVRIVIDARCEGCDHHRSTYYCVEDGNDIDSGFTHRCSHPDGKDARGASRIARSTSCTPSWCPFLEQATKTAFEQKDSP